MGEAFLRSKGEENDDEGSKRETGACPCRVNRLIFSGRLLYWPLHRFYADLGA